MWALSAKKHKDTTWAQEIFDRKVSQYLLNYKFNLISVDWMRIGHGLLTIRLHNKTLKKLKDSQDNSETSELEK